MALIRTIQINKKTKIGIWEINEPESYFLSDVSAQKEIKHPVKRLQHLAGRKLLKTLVPAFPVEKIEINICGKPYLRDKSYHFSITHSGKYAAVIVSEEDNVGIDLEKVSPKIKRLAGRFLSDLEYEQMTDNDTVYTLCWSAKETIYKWLGRKDANIRKNIRVEPFHIREEGEMMVSVDCDGFKHRLDANYECMGDFVLVWMNEAGFMT